MKHFLGLKSVTSKTFNILDKIRNLLMFCVIILIGTNIIGIFDKNLNVFFSIILFILSICLLTLSLFLLSIKIKD